MGKETLSLYILHAIILYGSVIGIGIKTYIGHSLSFTLSMIGALVFIFVLGIYVHYKHRMSLWFKSIFIKVKYAINLIF